MYSVFYLWTKTWVLNNQFIYLAKLIVSLVLTFIYCNFVVFLKKPVT